MVLLYTVDVSDVYMQEACMHVYTPSSYRMYRNVYNDILVIIFCQPQHYLPGRLHVQKLMYAITWHTSVFVLHAVFQVAGDRWYTVLSLHWETISIVIRRKFHVNNLHHDN